MQGSSVRCIGISWGIDVFNLRSCILLCWFVNICRQLADGPTGAHSWEYLFSCVLSFPLNCIIYFLLNFFQCIMNRAHFLCNLLAKSRIVSAVLKLNLSQLVRHNNIYQLIDFLQILLYSVHVTHIDKLIRICYWSPMKIAQFDRTFLWPYVWPQIILNQKWTLAFTHKLLYCVWCMHYFTVKFVLIFVLIQWSHHFCLIVL